MAGLLSPERAVELVLDQVKPLGSETVSIEAALERVLGADLTGAEDMPGFDGSAMDGFALRAADTTGARKEQPTWLEIAGESRAGAPANRPLRPRQVIRISTGAMVPAGADAVVRMEDTIERDGRVGIEVEVSPGNDIRRAGEDLRAGEQALARGTMIGPAELAVAALVGAAEIPCVKRPRLACISTGDELVPPREPLGPGQIRNTNAFAIPAQASSAGAEVVLTETIGDDREATAEAVRRALDADVVVLTGGVSVGPHDHVKPVLAELGVEQVFWGVAVRPGKPTWFGVHRDRPTLVFGLPGNPVSAMVTFHLFVEPALARLTGREVHRRHFNAIFDDDYRKRPGRAHLVRCRLEARDDGLHVRPTKAQGSHVLTSMVGADALAYLPLERADVSAGEAVEVELLF